MNAELLTLHGKDSEQPYYNEMGFLSAIADGAKWVLGKAFGDDDKDTEALQKQMEMMNQNMQMQLMMQQQKAAGGSFLDSPHFPLVLGAGALAAVLLLRKPKRGRSGRR